MITFSVDDEVGPIVTAAVLAVDGVRVLPRDARMDGPLADSERAVRASADKAGTVAAVRTMYRRFGVDPTKTRPSSEALLRRVRKGETLPRINSLVDLCNWCSLETQLPYGLYDLACVRGPVTLRLGREGEEYAGIRKGVVHVSGRLTLVDAEGPFGNPTSDSARSMVTVATSRVLVVIFVPADVPRSAADAALALTETRILQYAGGQVDARLVAP
jgi:DNA/RNA-binding domain of Phe-tRNA-synthetase-like protein